MNTSMAVPIVSSAIGVVGKSGGGLVEIEDTIAVARTIHDQHSFDLRALADCRQGDVALLSSDTIRILDSLLLTM